MFSADAMVDLRYPGFRMNDRSNGIEVDGANQGKSIPA
jgi:hypothetical protein